MRTAFNALVIAAMLGGCTTVGPLYRKDVDTLIAAGAELPATEPVRLFSRANYMPNTYGFKGMVADGFPVIIEGVIACTEERLLFVIWDDERREYVPRVNAPYADVEGVEVKTWGLSRRLVLRLRSAGFLTFELLTGAKIGVDQTETFSALISERLRNSAPPT